MGCCDKGAIKVQEALSAMLAEVTPVETFNTVSLATAFGHCLAEEVLSPLDMPPFDNSAMDGYAFRFNEWQEGHTLHETQEEAQDETMRNNFV